jgi:hypothetical protein
MKTEKEKSHLEKELAEKKRQQSERLRALFDLSDLSEYCVEKLEPTDMLLDAGWNRHSLFPVTREDDVFLHSDQSGVSDGHVRVIYYGKKYQATLAKSHFKNQNNGK